MSRGKMKRERGQLFFFFVLTSLLLLFRIRVYQSVMLMLCLDFGFFFLIVREEWIVKGENIIKESR